MAGGFTGTPEQFTDAEGRVTDVRARMDQNLSQLRDRIEATRAGWQGEAQKAFDHVMQRFDEDGRGMNEALQNIANLLQEAGSKYKRSEEQQQEIMQSMNKGFGVLG
ncbi:WXG100 family type VII secretion target [Amycolatopsis sp. PS_44_ISF1]|uniref:WXG100 family type VII secretion target n=1 Tax=Amycolatopsis sp. PS_44_ISF1 TaxID=2974917 RepID=UPI0028E08A60|nr:WXG100 family type VII secretion target [Amycolatopsis sp. PS_44_ISF1]MDT8909693.1 WXG100 family type VII secretion target [Amycolatopsis sp. PS_44_ISF1]